MIMPATKMRRKYIIVDVDTQRHFFSNPGIICIQDHRRVLANILKVIKWAKQKSIRTISTVQILPDHFTYYTPNIIGREKQKKVNYTLYKTYASLEATDCTDLPLAVLQHYNQLILHKRCFDPFEEPRVDRVLSELWAEQFIIIGAPAEGAVRATALGLLGRRKHVTVLCDATGSYKKMAGKIALRHISQRGAKIIRTEAFLNSAQAGC
jgi:nicotinamidase-related amidase